MTKWVAKMTNSAIHDVVKSRNGREYVNAWTNAANELSVFRTAIQWVWKI